MEYTIAALVFDFLTLIALLGFFVWSVIVKKRTTRLKDGSTPLPVGPIQLSIVSYIVSKVFEVVDYFDPYIAMFIISHIFFIITSILVFYCIHQIILAFLERISIGRKTWTCARLVHLCLISVMGLLAVAEVVVYIVYLVRFVDAGGRSEYSIANQYSIVYTVWAIVFLLCSLEVFGWVVFCVMPRSAPSQFNTTKSGARSLLAGSLFYVGIHITITIIVIRYNLLRYYEPFYMIVVIPVIWFVCAIGIYTGLLCCCRQWAGDVSDSDDLVQTEHDLPPPYGGFEQGYSFEQPVSPVSYNQNGFGSLGGRHQQVAF